MKVVHVRAADEDAKYGRRPDSKPARKGNRRHDVRPQTGKTMQHGIPSAVYAPVVPVYTVVDPDGQSGT